jgi:transcriptional regulator with XRE-family HTH domain
MPAQSPPINATASATLSALGRDIRARRKALSVSAILAAQAAGMSRVTLPRIEHGEPSVTMGAYLNAMAAMGLAMRVQDATPPPNPPRGVETASTPLPAMCVADYPQLQQLAWHLTGTSVLTPGEALNIYERNWRHLDFEAMDAKERAFLESLVLTLGKGHLLV